MSEGEGVDFWHQCSSLIPFPSFPSPARFSASPVVYVVMERHACHIGAGSCKPQRGRRTGKSACLFCSHSACPLFLLSLSFSLLPHPLSLLCTARQRRARVWPALSVTVLPFASFLSSVGRFVATSLASSPPPPLLLSSPLSAPSFQATAERRSTESAFPALPSHSKAPCAILSPTPSTLFFSLSLLSVPPPLLSPRRPLPNSNVGGCGGRSVAASCMRWRAGRGAPPARRLAPGALEAQPQGRASCSPPCPLALLSRPFSLFPSYACLLAPPAPSLSLPCAKRTLHAFL